MFGTPGIFFYLPSWHAWDQMVYDALFHVWQLLLTFGWVIYLQQARRPSCESSKRKSRSQCASAFQACARIAFVMSCGQSKSLGQDPTKLMWTGTVQGCVSQEAWLMGPIMYQSTKYTWDQGPGCFLIMSLPFSAGHLHSFTQSTCPYLESRDHFFSFPPIGNRCFLFNCVLKITGKNFDWSAVDQMLNPVLSNWDMIICGSQWNLKFGQRLQKGQF